MRGEVYFDGGARPTNPGPAGFGVLVRNTYTGKEIMVGRYVGWKTNNEAEYMGLIVGLKIAREMRCQHVTITGDSQLVLNTVFGEWKTKKDHLKLLVEEARNYASQFVEVNWVHVRGHQGHVENELCDTLCTNAINAYLNANPWRKKLLEGAAIVDPFAGQ